MIIKSVKASTLKLFFCIASALSVALILALMTPSAGFTPTFSGTDKTVYSGIDSNESRIAFLKSFGWEVQHEPLESVKVTVPTEFDAVFAGYNDLQKLQGLDLSRYKQKEVTRYTYLVTNYNGYDGRVHANLIIYRGNVVAGDICTEDASGFIHGFQKSTQL